MKKESILYGTVFLILTNLAVKIMSLLYRSILIRLIGAEGLGLTEMMMPFYSLLIVIASMGIPLAISNFISGETSEEKKWIIVKTGMTLLIAGSLLVTVFTLLLLPFFDHIIFSDQRVIPGFYILIPSVFLISVFSAFRGYFQGSHQASYIGRSQVTEQITRLIVGIALISYLITLKAPLPWIIVGTALASLIAEACGGCYLWRKFSIQKNNGKGHFNRIIAKGMVRSGIPITLSRLIISATAAIQASLVPKALMAEGASFAEAAAFYGLFAGVALTVLHLPSIITGALITPLIPAIASADSSGDTESRNTKIEKSIFFTNITALPILALLFYFSKEICDLLFASPDAGYMLSLLCTGGIFIYLQQPIIGILQGMNRFHRIFVHFLAADIFYIALLFYLTHTHQFTTESFILAFIVNDIMIFGLNYIYLKRITKFRHSIKNTYFSPILGLLGGGIVMISAEKYIMQTIATNILSLTLSACLFLIIYFFILYVCGAIDKKIISSFLSLRKRH